MSKCLVLFVEGDTEVEFYKQVIANARKLHPAGRFDTSIEYRNVRGVGGFKSIALRKFTKDIKTKYDSNCEFTIVLCSDTDVFDFAPKPPIKWDEVKKELKANGVSKVYFKGIKSNGMMTHLNIEKIAYAVEDQLNPLYKELGVYKTK